MKGLRINTLENGVEIPVTNLLDIIVGAGIETLAGLQETLALIGITATGVLSLKMDSHLRVMMNVTTAEVEIIGYVVALQLDVLYAIGKVILVLTVRKMAPILLGKVNIDTATTEVVAEKVIGVGAKALIKGIEIVHVLTPQVEV